MWFESCVTSSCNITDALAVARTNAEICNVPKRSRKGDLIGAIPLCALAFFANIFRLYSRWYLDTKFDTDDWVMLAVAVLFVPFQAVAQYGVFLGFGVDAWYVKPDDLTLALQFFYMAETFYLTTLGLTKISILFFFLWVFPNARFRVCCWTVMTWVALSSLIIITLQIFQCTPIDAIWRSWDGNYPGSYHCFNINALTYAAAGLSIAQDVAILVLPLPLILRLNTNWRRKIGIVIMFSLGIFVLITSCVRLRFIVLFARSRNPTWDYVDTHIWSDFEVSVSVIAASLPAIRLYLARVWPRAFPSVGRKASTQSSGAQLHELKRWKPLRMSKNSGETGNTAGQPVEGQPGYYSRLLEDTRLGGKRSVDVSEVELRDTVRGSVHNEISVGNSQDPGIEGSAQCIGCTGQISPLDLEDKGSSRDTISNMKPDVKAANSVETISAVDANLGTLAFAEAAEDEDEDEDGDEDDVGDEEPVAVSVASWTKYNIAT
ncbi:hypothetical protein N8I77_006238 [Diaporthe amygdali]|uniref:Rhodopsin domain-containing protein n=1 Tax=Phomopsis amygdali TaxID=1214568 RepID=A0AAD9SHJ5_PHOAM|nr:hypothetical protein N8I77_006238 [Diaporthe amygdali]